MPSPPVPAPLWRRLVAALYDGLLLVAVWLVAATVDEGVRELFGISYGPRWFRAYLFLVGLAFCGWFWTHGGQTLRTRAGRLQVRRVDGATLNWPTAAARYAWAWVAWLPLGLGVLWCGVDSQGK